MQKLLEFYIFSGKLEVLAGQDYHQILTLKNCALCRNGEKEGKREEEGCAKTDEAS